MAPVPNYAAGPRFSEAVISTANTAVDGTGTITAFFVPNATVGGRLDRIVVQALANTSAGKVHIFKRTGTGTWRFYHTVLVTAVTESATTPYFRGVLDGLAIDLQPTQEMGASTTVSQSLLVFGEGGDY